MELEEDDVGMEYDAKSGSGMAEGSRKQNTINNKAVTTLTDDYYPILISPSLVLLDLLSFGLLISTLTIFHQPVNAVSSS